MKIGEVSDILGEKRCSYKKISFYSNYSFASIHVFFSLCFLCLSQILIVWINIFSISILTWRIQVSSFLFHISVRFNTHQIAMQMSIYRSVTIIASAATQIKDPMPLPDLNKLGCLREILSMYNNDCECIRWRISLCESILSELVTLLAGAWTPTLIENPCFSSIGRKERTHLWKRSNRQWFGVNQHFVMVDEFAMFAT